MMRGILIIAALPLVLLIRIIRPWLIIRFDHVHPFIGHLAGDLELYLCARDLGINTPKKRHLDIFCVSSVCNYQLLAMWKRRLHFQPFWMINPILRMNRVIPGGDIHDIGTHNKHADRDVNGWLEPTKPHLEFTPDERIRGESALRAMGIPEGGRFICLLVRDSAYHKDQATHTHRNADIDNYVLMAEKMADLGYYVVRVGSQAQRRLRSKHKNIIDYSFGEHRNDFNDIYLGYGCFFCVANSSGWHNVPISLFRKPSVITDFAPFARCYTFINDNIMINKRHVDAHSKTLLSISEIMNRGVAGNRLNPKQMSLDEIYQSKGVSLVGNTPEEILDVTLEMVQRLEGSWRTQPEDEVLQKCFWDLFPVDALEAGVGEKLHGKIKARHGTHFLRKNHEWFLR